MKREIIIEKDSLTIRCDKNELLILNKTQEVTAANGNKFNKRTGTWVVQMKEHSVPSDKAKLLNMLLHEPDIAALRRFLNEEE